MKNRSGRSGQKLGSLFGKTLQRTALHRALRGESLEARHMMAGDVYLPYHNDLIPEDTNLDYSVTALDALMVINAINGGQLGELTGPGIGKADGPMFDVSGDNSLSPLDALKVINRINGEGEVGDIVGFSLKLADKNGVDLPANAVVPVGQTFLLKAFVQDLRGFDAQGIFGAYLDLDYTNGGQFQVQVGETQSFRYFYDKISTTDPTSSFKFTFGSETTAPISLFNGTSPRSADQVAAAIQSALEALPSIGTGNVTVRRDPVASAQDSAANLKRNSFDIQFVNAKAGQDVPLLTLDASNVKVQTGQTFEYTLTDKYPADPSNPESFASAFQFSDEFSSGRTATQGTNQFDEVGAFGGLSAPQNTTQPHLLFYVPLKALANGTVTFTPTPADVFPAHETLVFPKEVVPTDLIDYGSPLTVTIANNIVANTDTFTVAEDSAATQLDVTTNDQLINGTSFTIDSVTASQAGVTPTISADKKKVSYQPKANFFGTDTFTYTIKSNLGDVSTATVTMTVTAVNDPISVPNQTAATNLGKAVVLTTAQLTAGGTAGPGETTQQLSIASVVSPSTKGGTVSLSNGSVTYTPAAGFAGTDTFVVVATDDGQTNGVADPKTQSVTVTVTVTNDPPVATNDTLTVDEESTNNSLDVLANDNAGANDVNDALTITAVGSTPNATVTISNDKKTVLYTPAIGFVGADSFTYTVTDKAGATATATVNVTVEPTVLPRARTDNANTTEDDANGVVIDVLANDRVEVGSLPLLVDLGPIAPANGTVTIEGGATPDKTDDKIRYVPNANFSGQDTFTYILDEDVHGNDYRGPSEGTVTVNVAAVNDAPVVAGDTASTSEDTAVTISATTLLSNDSPGAGEQTQQTLTVKSVQAVTTGAGSVALSGGNVVYTPAPNFNGTFEFTYTAEDNGSPALSGTATVTVTVGAVNDAPVAGNDTVSAVEDTAKTIDAADLLANDKPGPASATDEASQTLTVVAVGSSANGATVTLAAGGGSVAYTPALNFFGTDTFTYTVRDSGNPALETTATATVNVSAVNDAPTAGNDTVTAFKGVPLTIVGTALLANDQPGPANESTQTLRITSVTGATNGDVVLQSNGDVVFTPAAGYTGPATFSYTVSDNGQTNGADDFKTATASVAVDVKDFIPSTVSGTLWVDETHDGKIDAAERRLGDVVVKLTGTSFGLPVSQTAITDADGHYAFDQLAPGSYTVSYVTPALLLDGADVAGSLGDSDGKVNNNSMSFTIGGIGGADASGYNFAVNGVNGSYGTLLEQLASSYYAANNKFASYGMYATLAKDGTQSSFFNLDGFDNIVFAEAAMSASGREVVLTIVESNHDVYTAVLGRGKFIALQDNAGNTVIRILGGRDQLPFTKVDMSAPELATPPVHYLEAVDQFFDQENI